MSKQVLILVATMSGTAEMVADEIADALARKAWQGKVRLMSEASVADLTAQEYCVFCVATYGTGELADNGKPLYEQLAQLRPDLSGLEYGVIGLGDSNYPQTYCRAGALVDELLSSLGAVRIGARLDYDRRSTVYPEEAAVAWLEGWLAAVDAAAEQVA